MEPMTLQCTGAHALITEQHQPGCIMHFLNFIFKMWHLTLASLIRKGYYGLGQEELKSVAVWGKIYFALKGHFSPIKLLCYSYLNIFKRIWVFYEDLIKYPLKYYIFYFIVLWACKNTYSLYLLRPKWQNITLTMFGGKYLRLP